MPQLLLLIPVFAILDRWWGGGLKVRLAGHGLGKPAALLIFPIGVLLGLPWPLALGLLLAFYAWRSPDMQLFGADLAPYPDQYLGTWLRHAIASVAYFLVFAVWKQGVELHWLILLAFPFAALAMAAWMRQSIDGDLDDGVAPENVADYNATVELVRGAVLGALVVGCIVWSA